MSEQTQADTDVLTSIPLVAQQESGQYSAAKGEWRVTFPSKLTGAVLKRYVDAQRKETEYVQERQWREVQAVAVELVAGDMTLRTPFDSADIAVVTFTKDALEEYLAPFLISADWRAMLSAMLRISQRK
ncbi:MAG: hypothetical protein M9928_21715 [Anaerolineae bacterium]|nr:hypothetical protein [Anaerolineae bacterium]MCO5195440.1 hypothetical protein [Anaerolineae bacterium]MCO5200002.1 hypothetical protein [Anaerolineae bacterium]MCO5207634.1 hypothetical protein [Anaerolineae bacterium]